MENTDGIRLVEPSAEYMESYLKAAEAIQASSNKNYTEFDIAKIDLEKCKHSEYFEKNVVKPLLDKQKDLLPLLLESRARQRGLRCTTLKGMSIRRTIRALRIKNGKKSVRKKIRTGS